MPEDKMTKKILFIHGMWSGSWVWDKYTDFFTQKGYDCDAYTLAYHNVSPNDQPDKHLGTISLLDYAEELETYIRKNYDSNPILIGHSMGGLLAQILGARCMANRLVLVAPGAPAGVPSLTFSAFRSIFWAFTKWGFWRKPHRPPFRTVVYFLLNLVPPEEHKDVYNQLVYESGRALWEVGFPFLDQAKAAYVDESKIDCPVLIISGKDDRIASALVIKKIAYKYKRIATYKNYENHTHWLISEPGWKIIADDIDNWLRLKPGNTPRTELK